ncbi:MAG: hypothetical protein JW715_12595 [Sedimentisphaerales bacterium]|nr:hypothetical protein [Sedimentisphaerales bacterium]
MSPVQTQGRTSVPDNLYTAILAIAFFAVLATTALVAYMCYTQYETIFKIAS